MLLYPATVMPDGDTFVVLFPDIPHAHTNGESRQDALKHAPDALQAGIAMLMEKGLDIPAPSRAGRGGELVGLPSAVASAKVQLYTALRAAGIDIDHSSRIEQLELAFGALGMRLTVDVEKAA
jgi:antitoxin HicB